MKAILVLGVILTVCGFAAIAYFVSPVRFMTQAFVPHAVDLKIPIAGVLSLGGGLALLYLFKVKNP
jgi:hypothetical protein